MSGKLICNISIPQMDSKLKEQKKKVMRGRVPGENKACYELPAGLTEEKECFPLKKIRFPNFW